MQDPWDEHRELRRAASENAWLRDLLLGVASGLERMAMEVPSQAGRLGRSAMWIRRQLWLGPPDDEPPGGIGVGAGPSRRPRD